MRPEIKSLLQLGALPPETGTPVDRIAQFQQLIEAIKRPVADDEARALVTIFGSDNCFGLAFSVLHLIESAPGWPLDDCMANTHNIWVAELRDRAIRGGNSL